MITPESNDVLFGRGFTIGAHSGNRHLRDVVRAQKPAFVAARKKEKRIIAMQIVEEIQNLDPPGRFLIEVSNQEGSEDDGGGEMEIFDRVWIIVETEKAVDKVMHRLREREKVATGVQDPKVPSQRGKKGKLLLVDGGSSITAPVSLERCRNVGMLPQQQQSLSLSSDGWTSFLQNMQQSSDGNFHSLGIEQARAVVNQLHSSCQPGVVTNNIGQLGIVQARQLINQNHSSYVPNVGTNNIRHIGMELISQDVNQQQAGSIQPDIALFDGNIVNQLIQGMDTLQQTNHQLVGMTLSSTENASITQTAGLSGGFNELFQQQTDLQQCSVQTFDAPQSACFSSTSDSTIKSIDEMLGCECHLMQVSGIAQPSVDRSELTYSTLQSINQMNRQQPSIRQVGMLHPSIESRDDRSINANYPSRLTMHEPTSLMDIPIKTDAESVRGNVNEDVSDFEWVNTFFDHEFFSDNMASIFDDVTSDNSKQEEIVRKPQQLISLHAWIDVTASRFFGNTLPSMKLHHTRGGIYPYIKSAIPLAIKLTEFLIEEEDRANPVPLASIACENVLVWLKEEVMDSRVQNDTDQTITHVMIKSCRCDSPDRGGDMPRSCLFALGAILYEIFSREPLCGRGADVSTLASSNSLSLQNLHLTKNEENRADDRPSKRSQWKLSRWRSSKSIAKLEMLGIPHSLTTLVGNLLENGSGTFQDDDAYRSFEDVLTDLRLMRDDPSCFLDNIQVGPYHSIEIRSKFYGREKEMSMIEMSYQHHISGGCMGIVVSGGAGVGKSSLVSEMTRKLARQSNAYYLEVKFDQNLDVNPLSTVGAVFNSLCDSFSRDATRGQLKEVSEELETALGHQAAHLVEVLPSLTKLVSISTYGSRNECVSLAEVEASTLFLLQKVFEILSQHTRCTLFLDDLQWADPMSLIVLSNMIGSTKPGSCVFFACCYRDDDLPQGDSESFSMWLSSVKMSPSPFEMMNLQNISVDGANNLLSDALHLSPRITRPLASIVHHKTQGNPLFLRQLLESLKCQGYIYLNLSLPRWAWDYEKIVNLEISSNVLAFLIKDIQRLPSDMQLALKVASCLGSCVKYLYFDLLSEDLGVNLREPLSQVATKGFMVHVDDTKIRFAHDKIQQAAYEMLTPQHRLENHMRFGLAICSHALSFSGVEHEDSFFLAVNQINRGGPDILANPNQKVMVAALNLKAGKRSIELSDLNTAFKLFESGIDFLDKVSCWTNQYRLSLEIFEAAVEAACSLNDVEAVSRLSNEVLENATCDDDKLSCLYAVAKSLRLAYKFDDSKLVGFTILEKLGERLPRLLHDIGFTADLQEIKRTIETMSDESILNMKETNRKKLDLLLMNLYHDLAYLFLLVDSKRIPDTALRMLQITLSNGLCVMSPVAFAAFAVCLVTAKDYTLGYRLGTIALRLLVKTGAQRCTSAVIAIVGHFIQWVAEPFQSISESHLLGQEYGQRSGDVTSSILNYQFHLNLFFLTGQSLPICIEKARELSRKLVRRKQEFILNNARCLYWQALACVEGLDFEEEDDGREKLPTWDEIATSPTSQNWDFSLVFSCHKYFRSFLFKVYDDLPQAGLLDRITENNVALRPILLYGLFFEGLLSFHFARRTDGNLHQGKGEAALTFFRDLAKVNTWNFENKYIILEAEMMNCYGYHEQALNLYTAAIRSANKHKLIHEEAIASELAGMHAYDQGMLLKSNYLLLHSVNCYKKWGAFAIARRVENVIQSKFGSEFASSVEPDTLQASILGQSEGLYLKKRG